MKAVLARRAVTERKIILCRKKNIWIGSKEKVFGYENRQKNSQIVNYEIPRRSSVIFCSWNY
jgi:hypothetical protein